MQCLYKAAAILRQAMKTTEKWEFHGDFHDMQEKHLPSELHKFYRWMLQDSFDQEQGVCLEADKTASMLAEYTITYFLNDRQLQNKTNRSTREMPNQLAGALTARHMFRSKRLVDLLSDFGICPGYNIILRIETSIANSSRCVNGCC